SGLGERFLRIVEVVALVGTAAIVWWYTSETQRLRETSEAQLLAAHEPLLILDKSVTGTGTVQVRNIGPGVAFGVTCQLTAAGMPDGSLDPAVGAELFRIGSIAPGEGFDWPSYHGLGAEAKTWGDVSYAWATMKIFFCNCIP